MSGFPEVRTAMIRSAKDLYGSDCAPEVLAVTNAWFAVGVGAEVPIPVRPTGTQPYATVCVNDIKTVAVAVDAQTRASSYSWTVPANWKINGGGTTLTTTSNSINVTPPAGTAANDYQIYVTANSATCGPSDVGTTYVRVGNYNTIPAPSGINFIGGSYSSSCHPTYDVICTPIVGATSYQATLSNGYSANGVYNQQGYSVRFPLGYQVNQYGGVSMSVTVTATGPCGTSSTTYGPQQLNGPTGQCGYGYAKTNSTASQEDTYPNPATDQVAVQGVDQEGQASFYDSQGVCCKVVPLHARDAETAVNLRDLPAGLYQVRVSVQNKVLRTTQLVIQH